MVRKENWPILLSGYLKERGKIPFTWGFNDCMTFMAYAVERLTGEQPWLEFDGYNTELEAYSELERLGGMQKIISDKLGQGHRNPLQANRGDVALVKIPHLTAGIVDDTGQRIAIISEGHGLLRLPINKAWRFWSY